MPSYQIKQSSTECPLVFLLVLASDHLTGLTGATPTVTISKSGGAFASPAGAVSEIANGWYKVAPNATDCGTLGPLVLHASAAGSDPTDALYEVVAVDPQSATNFITAVGGVNPDPWLTVLPGSYTGLQAGAVFGNYALPDGILAGATATTITLPATDAHGTAIADDGTYANTQFTFIGGTGAGQSPITTTSAASPRQYNVLPSSMPTPPDNTTQYVIASPRGNAYAADGFIAAATATTVTLPAVSPGGFFLFPDDGRYADTLLLVVAGTGIGQIITLISPTGNPREYTVLASTMPVPLDSTSQFQVRGSAGLASTLASTGRVTGLLNNLEFTLTFDGARPAAGALTDGSLLLSFTSGANQFHAQKITGGNLIGNSGATLIFGSPFTQAVALGDTFAIISN